MATNKEPATTAPPPKADAAPNGNKITAYKSLADAMNAQEQEYIKKGPFTIANQYEIIFVPPSLASAKVTTKGPTDTSSTPTTSGAVAAVSPSTNSVAMPAKNLSASQGQQIVQFIEETMRNSSYITDQQVASPNQTEAGGDLIANLSNKGKGPTAWFKILVNAVPIGSKMDPGRKDYAYRMTYIVTTYEINEMVSEYFPEARFRGVHKSYDYWFTGLNTQVLSYEQSYNALYTITAGPKDLAAGIGLLQSKDTVATAKVGDMGTLDLGDPKVTPNPPTESIKGANNSANTPAATAADFLYSAPDQKTVNIKIVGDPAWLLQGELLGLDEKNMCFTGFYPDGTVCTETQQVVFAINFNSPADYDNGKSGPASGTGLMDINAEATKGNSDNLSKVAPQASAAYTATQITSNFSKGKFEQTLTGAILKNLNKLQINKFAPRPNPPVDKTGSRTLTTDSSENGNQFAYPVNASPGIKYNPVNETSTILPNSATPVVDRSTQPATPAKPATSEGVVVGTKSTATNSVDYNKFRENNLAASNQYNSYKTTRIRELQPELERTLLAKNPTWSPSRVRGNAERQAANQASLDADNKFAAQLQASGAITSNTTSTPITGANTQQMAAKDQ